MTSLIPKFRMRRALFRNCLLSLSFLGSLSLSAASQPPVELPYPNDYEVSVTEVNASRTIIGNAVDSYSGKWTGLVWQDSKYQFVKLKGFRESLVTDLNNANAIVGVVRASNAHDIWPVIWKDGKGTLLPSLGFGGAALSINEAGDIVGFVTANGISGHTSMPAVWHAGKLSLLQTGEFTDVEVTSIDDNGDIYGYAIMAGSWDRVPVTWSDGAIRALPVDYGKDYHGESYTRRSASGFVSGVLIENLPGSTTEETYRAVAWENGAFRRLESLSNEGATSVWGVNHLGQFAGVDINYQTGDVVPVMWSKDGPNLLPAPSGSEMIAAALNDAGYVAGLDYTYGDPPVPVVWDLASEISISMANVTAVPGQTITLEATATRKALPQANQRVTFAINDEPLGEALTNSKGVATIAYTVPAKAAGLITVSAKAAGVDQIGSTTAVRHIIAGRSPTLAAVTPVAGPIGKKVTLTANLRLSTQNTALAGKPISFLVNGNSIGKATTDKFGIARISFVIPPGTKVGGSIPMEVRYAGDAASKPAIARASAYVTK